MRAPTVAVARVPVRLRPSPLLVVGQLAVTVVDRLPLRFGEVATEG